MQNYLISFESAQDVAQLETLKTVDKYKIKNYVLGQGSYAKTYLALKSDNTIFACKMITKTDLIQKINKSSDKGITKDFFLKSIRSEVQTWKKLKHKNIVYFEDYVETSNNVYFFIQYCSHGTLQSILQTRKFTHKEALQLFKQIVDGCSYLYDMGILHRDLKPDNILIHAGKVKIADFGFAKLVETDCLKNSSLQRTCVGTPIYMSPQVLSQKPYSIKCDVWSIGVILYRLIYGTLPWDQTDNLQHLIMQTKSEIYFPPSVSIDSSVSQLLTKMLAVEQKNRSSIKEIQLCLKLIQTKAVQ